MYSLSYTGFKVNETTRIMALDASEKVIFATEVKI